MSSSSQRPYSIRTRIKTDRLSQQSEQEQVRDHIPLEQGLRQIPDVPDLSKKPVRDHIPLEQGLRRSDAIQQ